MARRRMVRMTPLFFFCCFSSPFIGFPLCCWKASSIIVSKDVNDIGMDFSSKTCKYFGFPAYCAIWAIITFGSPSTLLHRFAMVENLTSFLSSMTSWLGIPKSKNPQHFSSSLHGFHSSLPRFCLISQKTKF
jgi:hypothetical protein